MSSSIIIPVVEKDEKIGSVFNHLFKVINQTEKSEFQQITWDFKNRLYFHPFFIAPLSIYKRNCKKKIEYKNISKACISYFNTIHFNDMLNINKGTNLQVTLEKYLKKNYIPICCFEIRNENVVNDLQTILQKIIEKQSNMSSLLRTPLSYFLSELICNIEQHSSSKFGYIYTQYIDSERCIALCIADEGITIYGSYAKTNRYMNIIGDNEAIALKMANEGYSTKDKPEAKFRGYGISSTKKMLIDGLGGDFFMFSGGAFHRHNRNSCDYVNLSKIFNWNGTIILMRIPIDVDKNFNYQKYIE